MNKYPTKILMFTESHFPSDIRVKKEAYVLIKEGYDVTVVALHDKNEKTKENIEGVQVYRIPELTLFKKDFDLSESCIKKLFHYFKSFFGYICEYLYFTLACLFMSFYIYFKKGFDVIHVHNPPDTLFILGVIYKLFGVKFVFDHHDLAPELFLSKYKRRNFLYKVLILSEKCTCKLANVIICTNNSYKRIEMERHSLASGKIFLVRNDPIIEDCFLESPEQDKKEEKQKTTILYIGSINPQDGLDVLLQILHYLVYKQKRMDFVCNVVGDGDSLSSVKEFTRKLELSEYIHFKGYVTDREKIKEYLNEADIAVEPAPDNELNRYSTFIKILEYMAAKKPIVSFDLEETRYSVNGSAILVKSGNLKSFASAIANLMDDKELRRSLGDKGFERIRKELNWGNASLNLIEAYNYLDI